MSLATLVYLALGLLVVAIGHRKWWAETGLIVEDYVAVQERAPRGMGLVAVWMGAVFFSLCFDVPLWPRAVWRWWLR